MGGETNRVVWRGVQPVDGIRGIWPARDATRVAANVQNVGVATSIIYTVGVGKKLFISSSGICSSLTSDLSAIGYTGVRDDEDATQYYMLFNEFKIKGQLTNFVNYFPALEAEAGWDIIAAGTHANLVVRGFIFGWLEDA